MVQGVGGPQADGLASAAGEADDAVVVAADGGGDGGGGGGPPGSGLDRWTCLLGTVGPPRWPGRGGRGPQGLRYLSPCRVFRGRVGFGTRFLPAM